MFSILSNTHYISVEMIIWVFSFIPYIWWITMIDFQVLIQSCISRISINWSLYNFLLCNTSFTVLIFCLEFLHPYLWVRLACIFSYNILVRILHQGYVGLIKHICEVFSLFLFFGKVYSRLAIFSSLKVWYIYKWSHLRL